MSNGREVWEVHGVQKRAGKDVLARESQTTVRIGVQGFELELTVEEARHLARVLQRLAKRVEARAPE